jgi:hypothetical protein
MPRIPALVSALLRDLTERLNDILGKNLVGIYLYGSMTQRAFNPGRSDVDCIVVMRWQMSAAHFTRIEGWLAGAAESNPWVARLQMQFLIRNKVLTMNAPACLFQFGVLKREGSDGNPIVWLNILKSGVILFGPPPETFVPPITCEIILHALKREAGYIREEISLNPASQWRDVPHYRAYAVMTLCRILYSFEKGTIVSKPQAARWAVKSLPAKFHKIIIQALHRDDDRNPIVLSRIAQFAEFTAARLETSSADGA